VGLRSGPAAVAFAFVDAATRLYPLPMGVTFMLEPKGDGTFNVG